MLSVHVLAEGERVPMLHDEQGVPLFYPTLFPAPSLIVFFGCVIRGRDYSVLRKYLADVNSNQGKDEFMIALTTSEVQSQ